MKPLKNKKRFDPRHFLAEKQENTAPKSDFSSLEWSLEEFVVDDPTPKGKPIEKNTKKDLGLPDEVTDKKSRNRERAIADTGMTEGGCGSETPLPALVQGPENLTPDEAYDTGYADAVEEIMDSISHLLHEPVGEPVAIEINEDDEDDEADEAEAARRNQLIQQQDLRRAKGVSGDVTMRAMRGGGVTKEEKKPDADGDGVPDWADEKPGEDDHAEVKEEAMNEQPSIEDMMKKSIKNAPYADMPTMEVTLNRKEPGVKETVPMVDSARSKNPEALKGIIRNWLRVGYGVDEVELTSDGQTVDVAEFLDIDPMEEQ
jgi:hypothetical protein